MAARGNLKSVTPEEQRHALVLAIARDIKDQQSDVELIKWRHLILSTLVTFTKYTDEDDLFWAATNHRESVGAQYEVVYYSTAGCWHKLGTMYACVCTHTHMQM
jgi:hypothetical protein